MINCQEFQQEVKHAKLFWSTKRKNPKQVWEGSPTSCILWWQRQFRGYCRPFCFQDAILDISSSPMAVVGPSLCWVKWLWSQAPGQICKTIWLIKQRERGWKSVLMLMLWFAGAVNPALKLLLPNQKHVIKNQDTVKIPSGGLSLFHSLLPIWLCIGRLLAKSSVSLCLPQAT